MLKLRVPESTTCRFGTLLYAEASSPYSDLLAHIDPIMRCCYRAYLTMGPISLHRIFGYPYPKGDHLEIDRGYIRSSEYSEYTDWLRYGSTLQVARTLLRSDLTGQHFNGTGEHEVYHAQSFGDVMPSWSSNLVTITPLKDLRSDGRSPEPLKGHGYILSNSPRWIRSDKLDYYPVYSTLPIYLTLQEDLPPVLIYNKLLFGRYPQHGEVSQVHNDSGFGGHRNITCRDIRWTLDDLHFRLAYELIIQESTTYFDGRWLTGKIYTGPFPALKLDVELDVSFQFSRNEDGTIPPSSEQLFFEDAVIGHEKWSYRCTQSNEIAADGWYYSSVGGYWHQSPGSLTTWTNRTYTQITSTPYAGSIVQPPSSALVACTLFTRERELIEGKFRSWFELNISDIRAASALSSAAAMSDLQSSTDTDILQNIAKLPDIAAQIPNIQAAIKIVRDLAHRELHPGEILDFLTQLRLQQSFQWRPEFDLLVKYLPKIAAAILSFTGKGNTISGRGRYDYDFLDSECYRTTHLTVRTKIVAANSFTDLAATYLRLDSLGILPTPANIWDLIPFSFVVNWFTNMGKRIRVLGTLANMWLLSPVVIVHSYELTSVFTPDELESMQIREAPGAESVVSMKIYKREVTRHVPLLGNTRFDFERPTGTPDWSVVASLLWQWMK